MPTPNPAEFEARLAGLNEMYLAAVDAYRHGIIDTLCRFARDFVPGAVAIDFEADIDWRWYLSCFVDQTGTEIELDADIIDLIDDTFGPSIYSELPDYENSYGHVLIETKAFESGKYTTSKEG